MPLPPFGNDWRVWDFTRPVHYEAARRSVAVPDQDPPGTSRNVRDAVPVAKRRAVTRREKSPSGGAYVGSEVFWLVPAAVLPAGLVPKVADVLVDDVAPGADGTRWAVFTAELQTWETVWKLGCVNLVLALELRDLVQVERAALSYDAAGAAVKAWPSGPEPNGGSVVYADVPARIQLVTQEVADERGIRAFEGKYDVTVGRPLTLIAEDRLRLPGGTYLDIQGYRQAARIDELPVVEGVRRP